MHTQLKQLREKPERNFIWTRDLCDSGTALLPTELWNYKGGKAGRWRYEWWWWMCTQLKQLWNQRLMSIYGFRTRKLCDTGSLTALYPNDVGSSYMVYLWVYYRVGVSFIVCATIMYHIWRILFFSWRIHVRGLSPKASFLTCPCCRF